MGEVAPSGNMTASGQYDVYGAKRAGGTATATSRQGFVGGLEHMADDETGLVYMGAWGCDLGTVYLPGGEFYRQWMVFL